jgi:hypothetical protein
MNYARYWRIWRAEYQRRHALELREERHICAKQAKPLRDKIRKARLAEGR